MGGIPTARYTALRGVQRSRKALRVLAVFTEHPLPMIDVREGSKISTPRERLLRAARQFGHEIDKRIDSSRPALIG